jgi:NAD(P)-dependent dehydrogenase (short-subunit alcohol dehydrogenase family)
MRERDRGRIVVVASVAGLVGAPYIAGYTASKHAAVGLVRAAAAEVAGSGVTVNAVCPGFVDSDMTDRTVARIAETTGRSPEDARASLERMQPLGRLVTPQEVAAAVGWLCSDLAAPVNGQTIVLDGGGVQG